MQVENTVAVSWNDLDAALVDGVAEQLAGVAVADVVLRRTAKV